MDRNRVFDDLNRVADEPTAKKSVKNQVITGAFN